MWIFEPHVAETVYEEWIKEMKIPVVRNAWLDRDKGVRKQDGRIASIITFDGKTYQVRMFIDATYDGDLMAAAGVEFSCWPRVGEDLRRVVGRRADRCAAPSSPLRLPQADLPYVVPGDPSTGVLPRISTEPPGTYGRFRLTASACA